MKYVVSDLHGEYDKFIKMLDKINFQKTDMLYILGDIVDRGMESIRLLQYIMKQSNMKVILGNHDEMALQSLTTGDVGYFSCWMSNGGESTLKQYEQLSFDEQREIINYLEKLPLWIYLEDEKCLLVHAGIDFKIDNMKDQDRDTLLWVRDEFVFNPNRLQNYTIIFGHTPTSFIKPQIRPMKIYHNNGRIGIDCGACFKNGRLACLRLDDMEEFYID